LLCIRTALFLSFALCLMAQSDQEYSGPAVLSRGQVPNPTTPAPITFRPYIGISGIYDSGLIPVSVTSNGQIPYTDSYGVELNLGLYGYHNWKHTTLALDYRGDFRHYSAASYYDGSDHFLSLILTHKPSRHIEFTLRNQAGTYSQNYFLPSVVPQNTFLQTPANDLYDNRVIFVSTAGDMTYQKSARLSFDLGGEGDLVRRRSTALYGVTSYSAHGDTQYRISRHTTIGVDYHYLHFDFTRAFGATDIHSVGLDLSRQLTKRMQVSVRLGGARVETQNLVQVAIDPAIAALLGISVGVQAAYHVNYSPDLTARLINMFHHAEFQLDYGDTLTPGNGVYVTSRMQTGDATYSYTGVRYWNFGVSATYSRLSALVQTLGSYTTYGGGVGVTRELTKSLHAVVRFDERHFKVAGSQFVHNEARVSFGLAFSPGDVPLALW
jgi:hypothetical protein